ncbi:MAG: hypothetical protein ACXVHU_04465 [Methanobacterium sp.]
MEDKIVLTINRLLSMAFEKPKLMHHYVKDEVCAKNLGNNRRS